MGFLGNHTSLSFGVEKSRVCKNTLLNVHVPLSDGAGVVLHQGDSSEIKRRCL